MLRRIQYALSAVAALSLLAFNVGCPEPTRPVAKPGAQPTDGPEPETKPAERPAEKSEPDDAAVVRALEDQYHKLKKDDQGRVVEVQLDYVDTEKTNEALELVAKLSNVTRLAARGPGVQNSSLEKLKGMKNLRVLDLDQSSVDDAGMEHLVGLPLVDINLKLTNVRDDGVAHLAKIPTLKQLKLIKTKVTNAGIVHVKGMANLEGVDLQDVKTVDSACLNDLKGLKKLKFLRIYGNTFEGEGLAPLAEMGSLRTLSMQYTNLDDTTVKHIKGLTNLEKLYLYGTQISDAGMAQLTGLTKLKELELRATTGVGVDVEYLTSFPELQLLDLSECNSVDDNTLKTVVKLTKLKDLNLWHTKVTDNGVVLLAALPGLTSLNLDDDPGVTDASMDTVGKLTNLEFLHIGATRVTDAGLAKLHNLKKLKQPGPDEAALVIKSLNVSDSAVDALKEAIPALKEFGALQR
jgi:internalin A